MRIVTSAQIAASSDKKYDDVCQFFYSLIHLDFRKFRILLLTFLFALYKKAFTIQAIMPSAIAKCNFVAGFVPILMHFIKEVNTAFHVLPTINNHTEYRY